MALATVKIISSGLDSHEPNFTYADLRETDLRGAKLSEANFLGADFHKASLEEADLSQANLGKASLIGANLRDADLSGADLSGADLQRAVLTEEQLAVVDGFIEERYREPISLSDVARAVSLSRGHLTTVVRRKTGRTVQEWIAERRMAGARRLLVETDLAVEEVGRRVGYGDPGYFVRSFRRAHGATPLGWRRAGRA